MARRTRNRLVTAAIGASLLLGGTLAAMATTASSTPSLPAVAPDRLVASVLQSMARVPSVSGKVATHVDIGLPQLPDEGPDAATGPAALLDSVTGDHTLRVWSSGDGTRITELLRFGERSIDLTRSEVWAWDAGLYTAYHIGPFSFRPARVWPSEGPLGPGGLDPLELARQSLDAITPSTLVQVDRSDRVAGRDCYVVALTPRTPDTLIGRIEVSIDAATRVPLGVAVFARGAGRPAISAGFSSVSFDPIAPSVYRFTPPPGAKVVQLQPPSGDSTSSGDEGRSVLSSARAKVSTDGSQGEYGRFPYGDGVRVFGHDWTTIVAIRTPPMATVAGSVAGIDLASFLPYSGPLLSVRLVARGDHDWLVYGAVRQAMLVGVERELS